MLPVIVILPPATIISCAGPLDPFPPDPVADEEVYIDFPPDPPPPECSVSPPYPAVAVVEVVPE